MSFRPFSVAVPMLLALSVLLVEARASAFCRSTTCKGAECPADDMGCPSTGKKLFWAGGCVGFSLQKDLTRNLKAEDVRATVRRAFTHWSGVACPTGGMASIAFSPLDDVTCKLSAYNDKGPNVNVILFQDYDFPYRGIDNTLAKTTVTFDAATGEIVDADIEVNAAFNEVTTGDTHVVYDLEGIMTHEIGHFIGIAHTQDPKATMNPAYEVGSTDFRSLEADDIAALCEVYPPSRKVACDPLPRGGLAVTCAPAAAAEESKSGCALAGGPPVPIGGRQPLPLVAIATALAVLGRRRS